MEGFVDCSALLRPCVYLLRYRGEVVYVGQSVKAIKRLYTHSSRQGPAYLRKHMFRFDEVWVRPCERGELSRVEGELIAKHRPRHNVRLAPKAGLAIKVRNTTLKLGNPRVVATPLAFERRI